MTKDFETAAEMRARLKKQEQIIDEKPKEKDRTPLDPFLRFLDETVRLGMIEVRELKRKREAGAKEGRDADLDIHQTASLIRSACEALKAFSDATAKHNIDEDPDDEEKQEDIERLLRLRDLEKARGKGTL